MRKFTFWNENGDEKDTEQTSLKKAVRAVQGDYKDRFISVEYVSKKVNKSVNLQKYQQVEKLDKQ